MYDYLIITHLPAFYKINLYNEIAKNKKILVVFLGLKSSQRTNDFISEKHNFETIYLSNEDFEARNKVVCFLSFFKILITTRFRRLLVSGWEHPEFWLGILFSSKRKNCLSLESSIYESQLMGFKAFLKKLFLSRLGLVFASGKSHSLLLEKLCYSGQVIETKGVGIINKTENGIALNSYSRKFLFLGRLSKEKNIESLINFFNARSDFFLTIVGNGPLREEIQKKIKSNNIILISHVKNSLVGDLLKENNFLILPSLREPWGLVVEEALYYNRPVIVSSLAGAAELIVNGKNGFVFDPDNTSAVEEILDSIDEVIYQSMLVFIRENSLDKKDIRQVECYL